MPDITIARQVAAGEPELEQYFSAASTQYTRGALLKMVNGSAALCSSQTDKPTKIYINLITPDATVRPSAFDLSTAVCEQVLVAPVSGRIAILQHFLTGIAAPPITAGVCATNATSTQVIVNATGGANNDYVGGTIMLNEVGAGQYGRKLGQRQITASAWNSGTLQYTFTLNKPFGPDVLGLNPPAPFIATVGNTVTVVPFGPGMYGVKLNPTTPSQGLSTAKGDITSGFALIDDVDLTIGAQKVLFSFPNFF